MPGEADSRINAPRESMLLILTHFVGVAVLFLLPHWLGPRDNCALEWAKLQSHRILIRTRSTSPVLATTESLRESMMTSMLAALRWRQEGKLWRCARWMSLDFSTMTCSKFVNK